MKKNLALFIFMLLLVQLSTALGGSEVRVIAKIKAVGDSKLEMTARDQTITPFIRFAHPKLEKIVKGLNPEDEVLLSGKVEQLTERRNDNVQIRTLFIIEDVRPVSLERLGNVKDMEIAERPMHFTLARGPYSPNGIPVTKEVAASITITASVLMLRSLAANPQEPAGRGQLNEAVIFSAGALATGVFIWDQLTDKSF